METMTCDLKRAFREHKRQSPLTAFEKVKCVRRNMGLKALLAYRLRCYIDNCHFGMLCAPIKWLSLAVTSSLCFLIRLLYGIHLHHEARIGDGLYIAHFGGIAIGKCCIGRNCSIAHQVQIGSMTPNETEKGPIIGDRVWIGAHAKVLGDVVIESGATIVSGSVVTSDVKQNTMVMGNPARVIKRNHDNSYLM